MLGREGAGALTEGGRGAQLPDMSEGLGAAP